MRKSWIRLTTYRRKGREGKRESNKRKKAENENGTREWKKESLRRETEMSIVTQDRVITRETHSLVGFVMSEMKSLREEEEDVIQSHWLSLFSLSLSSVPFCFSPSQIPLFHFFFFTHTTFHSKFVYVKYNNSHRREYEGREAKRGKRERKKVRRRRGIKIAFYFPSGNWSLLALLLFSFPLHFRIHFSISSSLLNFTLIWPLTYSYFFLSFFLSLSFFLFLSLLHFQSHKYHFVPLFPVPCVIS